MPPRVNVECPHCGQLFAQELFGLVPGLWRHCPNCDGTIRFTAADIRHLWEAIQKRK